MQTLNLPKADGVSVEPAIEYNSLANELQNLVTGTGQTFDAADLNQLGKAMSIYAAGGNFYVDTGAANAYVLGVIGGKQAPKVYFDGMLARFIAGNSNSGASTVNVAGLGVKNIKLDNIGTAVPAGYILANREISLSYNSSGGYFILLPHSVPNLFIGASVYLASNFTLPDGVSTKIPLDTVEYDTDAIWNAPGNRLIPKRSGYFNFTSTIHSTAAAPGSYVIALYKNGGGYKVLSQLSASAAQDIGPSGSADVPVNGTTDYLEVFALQTTGVDMTVRGGAPTAGGSFMQLSFLGR